MSSPNNIEKSFSLARERYAEQGVDVDRVLKNLEKVTVSLH
jgi:L-rhamnose isomerase